MPPLLSFPALQSTNQTAHVYAQLPFKNGFALSSLIQTKGQGSRGRPWTSPHGNLYMSFLFSPHINQKNSSLPHDLLVVASLAVFTTLKNLSIPNLSIKWPNDILSQGKKISGILIETSFQNEKPLYTIIGVGMNVLSSPPQLHAAHIAQFREPPPLHSLQKQLQTHMISFFQKLPQQNLSSEYAQHLHLLNQNISLNLQDEVHHGIFRGISNNGALILEIHGEKRLFYTGNVLASSPNTSNSTYLPSISPS